MAKEAPTVDSPLFFIGSDRGEVIKVALIGLIIGALAPALGILLSKYFIEPVFCQSTDNFSLCATGGNFAFNISTIILAIAGTAALARLRVYRPLLIAVASAVALWGLKKYLDGLQSSPIEYYAWFSALYALSYMVFFWLLRIRNFIVSLITVIIVVILVRFILVTS